MDHLIFEGGERGGGGWVGGNGPFFPNEMELSVLTICTKCSFSTESSSSTWKISRISNRNSKIGLNRKRPRALALL